MARPGAEAIQLDLVLDFALCLSFQACFREKQPPFPAAGTNTMPTSSRREHTPTGVTFPRPKSICSMRGIVHLKPMRRRSDS